MPTDPLALLSRALDQQGALIAEVRRDQLELPTPCRSWDVAALVNHVVHDLGQFAAQAGGGSPDWTAVAAEVGDARVELYREGAAALLEVWRQAGDLDQAVSIPGMGELPARFFLDQQTAEFAIHAWDLATATASRIELDPEVAEAALAWAMGAMRPEFRGDEAGGKVFGPVVTVAPDAPAHDRLAGFFGRHPG